MTIFLGIIAGLAILAIYYFNTLVSLKIRARNAWADVDVQLKRRYDLVPNLVEVVKGYAVHERRLFERVAELRSRAVGASGAWAKAAPEVEFTQSLARLLAVVENYPDLKADKQFQNLQVNLTTVENDLSLARRYYNAVVRDYNTLIQQFPQNLMASVFHFGPLAFFEAGDEERQAVKVSV
jgi:LemA protein